MTKRLLISILTIFPLFLEAADVPLRFDGFYAFKQEKAHPRINSFQCYRFYENGTVLFALIASESINVTDISKWFVIPRANNNGIYLSKWKLEGNEVIFSIADRKCVGNFIDDKLHININYTSSKHKKNYNSEFYSLPNPTGDKVKSEEKPSNQSAQTTPTNAPCRLPRMAFTMLRK